MTLNYVTLTCDLYDGQGNPAVSGQAAFTPSAVLTDAGVEIIGQQPIPAVFRAGGLPAVKLLATDNSAPQPSGWTWGVTFTGITGAPAGFSFFLSALAVSFTATNASPCVFTVGSGSAPVNGSGVQLAGGSLPAGFTAGTTYYVVSASGTTFQLATAIGGSALGSTGSGSGTVTVVSQLLSNLIPVSSGTAFQGYLPLPTGTPSSGQAPIATGSGEASAWGNVLSNPMTTAGDIITGGSSGAPQRLAAGSNGQALLISGGVPAWGTVVTDPMTTLGDTVYGGSGGAFTRLAGDTSNTRKFLREQASGGVAQAPAWDTLQAGDVPDLAYVDSVTAADGSIVVGGASDAPTVRTGTLDVIASQHPPAAPVGMNSQKITSLANGTASSDAAAYGQTPAGGNTATIGQGGTGATTQQAAIDALTGTQSSGKVLRSDGTHATLSAIQSGDLPDLAYVDSVSAADTSIVVGGASDAPTVRTGTLDVIAAQHPAAADWSNNSHKITSLANGTASSDAAAYGQIPVADSTSSDIQPVGTAAAAGSNGKWADSGHVHAGVQLAGDLGNTISSPQVVSTHLSAALPVNQGGTGSTSRNFAGLLTPTAVKTGAYTASSGDWVPCDTTSAAFTVTLPTAPADLTVIGVKMVKQGSANAVTVAAGGSDVFNVASGATTLSLPLLNQGVLLQYKSSSAIWYVFADDLPLAQLDGRYVASVTAADTSVVVGGSASAPTVRTGTLDVIAADHPAAADWSNNSHKITSVANGTGAQDAAAYGQTLAGGNGSPLTTLGDILYENATPAPARLAGNTSATKNFLTQTGTGSVSAAPAWGTIAAGDLPAATSGAQGAVQLTGDLGNTAASPQVVSTHLSSPLPINQGGTGTATGAPQNDVFAGPTSGTGAPAFRALVAADIPDLAYVDTVSATDSSITITGATDTPSVASVPAQLIQRILCV